MEKEIKIILAVGILWIIFINLTRVVWKTTETDGPIRLHKEVACLQGGGKIIKTNDGYYHSCEKP